MVVPLLLLFITTHSPALDEESTRTGDELVTTLQLEIKDLADAEGDNNEVAAIRNYLRQVQAALTQDNFRSIEQMLTNFGNYNPSEKAQQGIDALREAISDELRANTDAVILELKGILDVARETVSRAAEPEELDKILETLSRNRFTNQRNSETYDSNDPVVRGLMSELGSARQFVTSWQDYLQASNAGDLSRATQALGNLADNEVTLIPRSRIIARIEFERAGGEELARISASITSLGEMKGAIEKLSAQVGSRSSSSDNPAIKETLANLVRLEKVYREFQAGLPVSLEIIQDSTTSSGMLEKLDFIGLRAQLLLLVLPRYLDLPESFAANEGETVDGFLDRAMDDATARADAAAARRIKDTSLMLVKSGNFRQADLDALRDYAAGLSQMEAGQHLLAVVSLQKALSSGSDLIPSAETGAMLKTIREKHPEEFEQGMLEFLTPHPTPEYDYSRMPYRGYRPSYSRNREESGTTVVLPVPSKAAESRAGSAPAKP